MLTSLAVTTLMKVNLKGSWAKFWAALKGGSTIDPLLSVAGVVGVLIVVVAIISWAWQRRRSGMRGGGGSGGIVGALIIGALLSAPEVLIPMVLEIFDLVANAAIAVWNGAIKS